MSWTVRQLFLRYMIEYVVWGGRPQGDVPDGAGQPNLEIQDPGGASKDHVLQRQGRQSPIP